MADHRIPGPLDNSRGNRDVRDGTLQRRPGITPGTINGATAGTTSAWDRIAVVDRLKMLRQFGALKLPFTRA